MDISTGITIGFIGFGEVGQTFAKGFGKSGKVTLCACDILFGSRPGRRLEEAADRLGVRRAATAADMVADSQVIISAVTADQVLVVAQEVAPLLLAGQIVFDVNSAAPATKSEAARMIMAAGGDYVEGAVMAPVKPKGLATPILGGGPAAERLAAILNPLGMEITPVATEFGRASAMKLCRSIVIKGLEAILVESSVAAAEWGVSDQVFASLKQSFPALDWSSLTENMRERVETHGIRRAAEMREAAEMLRSREHDPVLALAIAQVQQRYAKQNK